ncbi:hypothetical protein QMK22_15915 [Cryobacterium sp. PH29-G1]|nr:hypothetical protein [Cryobacterium sp. PH29-G1]
MELPSWEGLDLFQPNDAPYFAHLNYTLNCEEPLWPTRARAIQGVAEWIEDRYNRRQRHSSIGHVTPVRGAILVTGL